MAERRGKAIGVPLPQPWKPRDDYEVADAAALQAVSLGTASADQQRRAYHYIVHVIAATYDVSFRPGGLEGDRDTAFAEGKRMVGTQLVKFANLNISMLLKKTREQGPVAGPREPTEQPAPRSE